jgi:ABC-type spermidine/putrescine transport system permease subunit II
MTISLLLIASGLVVGVRFLYYFFTAGGEGHVQSLILASILLGVGFQMAAVAFLADLQAVNRRLLEDIQYRLRKMKSESGKG